MKRTESSKRKVGIVLLLLIAVISVLTMTACDDKLENVTALAVKEGTVPDVAVIGSFNVGDIILIVTTGEGEGAQTQEIAATISMLTADSAAKLKTPGRQQLTLSYQQKTVVFEVLLVEEGTQTYTVEFMDADGALLKRCKAVVGESVTNAPTPPTVSDKSFDCWREVGGTAATYKDAADIKGTEDKQVIQVKAEYSQYAKEYNVKFVDYEGKTVWERKVRHGEQVNPPSYSKPADIESYNWGDGVSFPVIVTGDLTFNMSFDFVKVNVKYAYAFESKPGEKYELKDYAEKIKINTNATKTKDVENYIAKTLGFKFKAWQTSTDNIGTDVTLVAIVESTPITVTLDFEGYEPNRSGTYLPNDLYPLKDTVVGTREGMVFTGKWQGDDGQEYSDDFLVSKNLVLKPIFTQKSTPVQYRITFKGLYDANVNEITRIVNDETCQYGDKIDFAAVEKKLNELKAEDETLAGYEVSQIMFNLKDVTSEITTLEEIVGGGTHHVFEVTAVNPEKEASDIFTYSVDGENVTITGLEEGNTSKILYIPKTHQNKTVTKIGNEAFKKADIVKIVFPDTIKEIGDGAFAGATLHSDIAFPDLTVFGHDMFVGAKSESGIAITFGDNSTFAEFCADTFNGSKGILKVTFPKSVKKVIASEVHDTDVGAEANDVEEVNLDNVEAIGDYAFKNSKLKNVGSLANVTEIGKEALYGVKLTSLEMPKLKVMGENAVSNMDELRTLSVATDVTAASVKEGIEFNLMWLAGCTSLETVTFGDGVTSVILSTPAIALSSTPKQALANGSILNLPSVREINISKSTVFISYVVYEEENPEGTPEATAEEEAAVVDSTGDVLVVFSGLLSINVAEGNPVFASHDGVLYAIHAFDDENDDTFEFLTQELGMDYKIGDKLAAMTMFPRAKGGDYTVCDTINGADVINVHGMLGFSEIHTLNLNNKFIEMFAANAKYMIDNNSEPDVEPKVELGIFPDDLPADSEFIGIYNVTLNGALLGEGDDFVRIFKMFKKAFFPVRNYYIVNAREEDMKKLYESEPEWAEKVFAFDGAKLSVYDATLKLAYTVSNGEATIILGDKSLNTIVIPETIGESNYKVVAIANDAFYNYVELKKIEINATLKYLSGMAFIGCTSLEEIYVKAFAGNAETPDFDSGEFYNSTPYGKKNDLIILGGVLIVYNDINADDEITAEKLEGITVIPKDFFKDKTTIKSVKLPDSVKEIGASAFAGCSIETIDLNKVEKIGDGAFKGCKKLANVELINVTVLGTGVFENCAGLKKAVLPNAVNVTSGGKLPINTFAGCIALTEVSMPKIIGFAEDAAGNSYAFDGCSALKDIGFVYNYNKIPGYAFRNCGVEVFDSSLFRSDITEITIGLGAFYNCADLRSIILISAVKNVGSFAFYGCAELKSVQLMGRGGILASNAIIGDNIFPDGGDYKIYTTADDFTKIKDYESRIERVYPTVSYQMYPGFEAGENNLNLQASNGSVYLDKAKEAPGFDGYTFDNWYYLVNGEYVMVEFPFHVTGNTVLYAKYIDQYKGTLTPDDVTFDEENQEFWVTSYTNTTDKTVYIPSMFTHEVYGTYPITVVYSGAFEECNALKRLELPEGVKELRCGKYEIGVDPEASVGRQTFNPALTSIKIPASLEYINGYVFTDLGNLTEIEFAENSAFRLVKNVYKEGEEGQSEQRHNPRAAFEGCAWYTELRHLAETGAGVNSGLIIIGGVAIEYIERTPNPRPTIEVPARVIRLASYLFEGNTEMNEIVLNQGLQSIGEGCFKGATGLQKVRYAGNQFDSSLIEVEKEAFDGTPYYRGLDDLVIVGTLLVENRDQNGKYVIEIPDYVTEIAPGAFAGTSVREVVFGQNSKLVKIGDGAFEESYLESITLPASVKYLGEKLFKNCDHLKLADLSKVDIEILPKETFYSTPVINTASEGVGHAGGRTSSSSLEEVRLSDSVKYFGLGSLEGCLKLATIVANGLLAGIDGKGNTSADWFWDDTAGENIGGIKDGNKRVGIRDTALYTNFGKESSTEEQWLILGKVLLRYLAPGERYENADEEVVATIPDTVESIIFEAFTNSGVNKVIIPASVKDICTGAFMGCDTLTEVVIEGNGLTRIGPQAFGPHAGNGKNCSGLVKINLPESLLTIGDNAFESCKSLKEIIIPDSVTDIGEYAFNNSGLVSVRLGSNLNMIGHSAFANCEALYKVEWDITENAFNALNENLLAANDNDFDELTGHIASLVAKGTQAVRLRFYVQSKLYNYIVSATADGDHVARCAYAWAKINSEEVRLEVQGNYPTVTFRGAGTDYEYQPMQTELIESLNDPKRTDYTFMGWYIDEDYSERLVLPYPVDRDIILYPMWYKNNLDSADDNDQGSIDALNFEDSEDKKYKIITGVNTAYETLYIPTSIDGKEIRRIEIAGTVTGVKKLIFTDASLYGGITENFFRCFPDLEEVEFISEGAGSVHMQFNDGVIYSSDGATLIAYLKRYEKDESGSFVVDDNGERILLRHFAVPDTVEDILPYAFANSGLTSVHIGAGVKRIGVDAFNTAEDLEAYKTNPEAYIVKEITFAENIYMTEVDKTAFENTAWYDKDNRINWQHINDDRGRLVGLMRSAGNVLIAYRQSAKTTDLKIPTQIDNFDITVIASEILVSENKCDFETVTLPEKLVKINSEAFKNIGINSNVIYTGNDLSDIANDVFGETYWYKESGGEMLTLGNVLLRYNGTGGGEQLDLSGENYKHITAIANNAFVGSRVRSILLPSGLKNIGDMAFFGCYVLESIEIPINVISIGNEAFASCTALATVTFESQLNSKLVSIGARAFENDTSLTVIEIPYTVETIGESAFHACNLLSHITFDYSEQGGEASRLKELGASAFYGCGSLVEVKIPDGLTEIKETTFAECVLLENVVFDIARSKVKVIGKEAFAGCKQLGKKLADLEKPDLATVVTPGNLEVVETGAFKNCANMLGIRFYSHVKQIQGGAFEGCLSLTKIDICRNMPIEIEENTFAREGSDGSKPRYNLRIYVTGSFSAAEGEAIIDSFKKEWGETNSKYLHERSDLPQIVYRRGDDSSDTNGRIIYTDVVVEPTYTFGTGEGAETVRNWVYDKLEVKTKDNDGNYGFGAPTGDDVPEHYQMRLDKSIREKDIMLMQDDRLILIVDWDKVTLRKA